MGVILDANREVARAICTEGWNRGAFERVRSAFAPTFAVEVHGDARSMSLADLERQLASA